MSSNNVIIVCVSFAMVFICGFFFGSIWEVRKNSKRQRAWYARGWNRCIDAARAIRFLPFKISENIDPGQIVGVPPLHVDSHDTLHKLLKCMGVDYFEFESGTLYVPAEFVDLVTYELKWRATPEFQIAVAAVRPPT